MKEREPGRYDRQNKGHFESKRKSYVFPVPGGPAKSKARPAIFLLLISSQTIPAAFPSTAKRPVLPLAWTGTHLPRIALSDQPGSNVDGVSLLI